ELWQRLGHESTVTYAKFPEADPDYLVADTVTCVVQVKGKVRARLEVAPDISEEALEELALQSPNAVKALGGAGVRKTIVRAPKRVNIVPDARGPAADTAPKPGSWKTARVPAATIGDSPPDYDW